MHIFRAACLVSSLLLAAAMAQDGAKPPGVGEIARVIAVVDLEKVKNGSPQVAEIQKAMSRKQAELRADIEERTRGAEVKKAERDTLNKESEAWHLADIQLKAYAYELEERAKRYERQLADLQGRLVAQFYDEIRGVIAGLARQRGLGLVLRIHESEVEAMNVAEIAGTNRARDVLYFDPKLDITDDVIRLMKARQPVAESRPKDAKDSNPPADAAGKVEGK